MRDGEGFPTRHTKHLRLGVFASARTPFPRRPHTAGCSSPSYSELSCRSAFQGHLPLTTPPNVVHLRPGTLCLLQFMKRAPKIAPSVEDTLHHGSTSPVCSVRPQTRPARRRKASRVGFSTCRARGGLHGGGALETGEGAGQCRRET